MIRIGTASAIITPPEGFPLCGYPNGAERANTGVQMDLKVKALSMDDGSSRILIITSDLIGMKADVVKKIRKGISEKTGIPGGSVLLSFSHTHSGPFLGAYGPVIPDPEYLEKVVKAFIQAGFQSTGEMIPVTVGAGTGEVDLCHNRRVLDENGKSSSGWQDPDHQHTGPVDKRVYCLVFKDLKNKIRALVGNYACHPVVMGPENDKVSPDFPGYMQAYLEKAFPGAMAMFTNAGGGNINPYICIGHDPREAQKMGETLGAEIARTAAAAQTEDIDSVGVKNFPVILPPSPRLQEKSSAAIETEVQMLRIGRKLLIVTAPGELLVETALRIKEQSPFQETLNFAYANDSVGYLPSPDILDQGGYEVDSAGTHVYEPTVLKLIREEASQI